MLDLAEGVRVDRVVWAGLLFGFWTLSEMSVEVASRILTLPVCAHDASRDLVIRARRQLARGR